MTRSRDNQTSAFRPRISVKIAFTGGILCMLLLLPQPVLAADPVTIGGGDAVQGCESAHTEVLPENQIMEPEDHDGTSSSQEAEIFPEYESCFTVTGGCKVSTKTSTTAAYLKTGWAVSAFFDAGIGGARSKTVTTITCEGTYLFTVTYSGGLTIYQGQSTLLTAQTIEDDDVSEDGPVSETCTYIAALGSCSTAHKNDWGGKLVLSTPPPETLTLCVKANILVDDNLLKLPYLGTSGYESHCFNAMKLVVDGDAAAERVQQLIGSSS